MASNGIRRLIFKRKVEQNTAALCSTFQMDYDHEIRELEVRRQELEAARQAEIDARPENVERRRRMADIDAREKAHKDQIAELKRQAWQMQSQISKMEREASDFTLERCIVRECRLEETNPSGYPRMPGNYKGMYCPKHQPEKKPVQMFKPPPPQYSWSNGSSINNNNPRPSRQRIF